MLRIRDMAATWTRYGYFRIYILLRREGWFVNHKRVYRLYRDDGLSLRLKKPRRNVSAANRDRQPAAAAANEMWSMYFVSDALFDGRRLRALPVIDAFTREALAIDVDQGIKGEQVVEVMARISLSAVRPRSSGWTMGRSSSRRHSTAGRTKTASRSTSVGRANRPTMRSWSRSTAACATSV